MEANKHIFKDKQAVAEAFAEYLAHQITTQDSYTIALSGGSTPKILFDHLARHYAGKIDWSKVKLFWGDERCVPPTDDQSNYKMTREHLLDHIDIPELNVFRVRGEDDPDQEAMRYGKVLSENLPISGELPQFDLVILGMGEDGHTASIFPHQIELIQDANPTAVATHPDSGQKRISLTGPIINNAKKICFLVTGASKADKVKEIFDNIPEAQSYPATYIHPIDGELHWWMDRDASKGLI